MIPFSLATTIEENTNGLLSQCLPNSTDDLSKYSLADLRRIKESLNDRLGKDPRIPQTSGGTR